MFQLMSRCSQCHNFRQDLARKDHKIAELERQVQELEQRIQRLPVLEKQITQLLQIHNPHTPPSQIPVYAKKSGDRVLMLPGRARKTGSTRTFVADRIEDAFVSECEHCGTQLSELEQECLGAYQRIELEGVVQQAVSKFGENLPCDLPFL